MTETYLRLVADTLTVKPITIHNLDVAESITNTLEIFAHTILEVPPRDCYIDVDRNTLTLVESCDVDDTIHIVVQIDRISFSGLVMDLNLSTKDAHGNSYTITIYDVQLCYI